MFALMQKLLITGRTCAKVFHHFLDPSRHRQQGRDLWRSDGTGRADQSQVAADSGQEIAWPRCHADRIDQSPAPVRALVSAPGPLATQQFRKYINITHILQLINSSQSSTCNVITKCN